MEQPETTKTTTVTRNIHYNFYGVLGILGWMQILVSCSLACVWWLGWLAGLAVFFAISGLAFILIQKLGE